MSNGWETKTFPVMFVLFLISYFLFLISYFLFLICPISNEIKVYAHAQRLSYNTR